MKVLLDTNIIIHREASRVVNSDIGVLFYWLDKLHLSKYIHPLTIKEVENYADKKIVDAFKIKLSSYHILKTEPPLHPDLEIHTKKVDLTQNDTEDTRLLNILFHGRVDLLITEDKKIHSKAALAGIGDKVFRIDSFLEKVIAENPELVDYKVLAVKKEYFGNIELEDTFFNSFKEDYNGFNKWFKDKSEDIAYVCYNKDELTAFLYLKVESTTENYVNIEPRFLPAKRLKVGTFKVVSNGLRIGERFLKIVFDNARQFKVDEIYVTIFDKRPEQLRLIALFEEYGFTFHGIKTTSSGTEKVYVRNFAKHADIKNPKLTFPYLSREAKVYTIPIRPEYHTELFPDSILRTESPTSFVENEPYRNAIKKVYISHAIERRLKSGDIIVFYRSGGIYKGVVTTIGIVENTVIGIKDLDQLIDITKKRTVLNEKELEEYWNRNPKNRPFVINFLYAYSFKNRLNLKALLDNHILTDMSDIKTIKELEWKAFEKLVKLAGL